MKTLLLLLFLKSLISFPGWLTDFCQSADNQTFTSIWGCLLSVYFPSINIYCMCVYFSSKENIYIMGELWTYCMLNPILSKNCQTLEAHHTGRQKIKRNAMESGIIACFLHYWLIIILYNAYLLHSEMNSSKFSKGGPLVKWRPHIQEGSAQCTAWAACIVFLWIWALTCTYNAQNNHHYEFCQFNTVW